MKKKLQRFFCFFGWLMMGLLSMALFFNPFCVQHFAKYPVLMFFGISTVVYIILTLIETGNFC